MNHVEKKLDESLFLGEKFYKFKSEITNLHSTLEKSFNETMKRIQSGMTEIADEETVTADDYTFKQSSEWFCVVCRKTNEQQY